MNRLAVLVGACVLAALAGFWLLRDTGDATQHVVAPAAPAASAVNAANPAPAIANAPMPERSEATPAATQPPIAADAPWFDVLVVDADQRPVASAEVLWTTQSMFVPPEHRAAWSTHPDDIARRFGWHTRSDARGMARVAGDPLGATVHALEQGRYGMVHVGGPRAAPPEGWRIVLAADWTLRVLVLDANDQPVAGIPVATRLVDPDPARNAQLQGIRNRAVTAHDGMATFVHLQQWRLLEVQPGTADRATWHVFAALPGLDVAATAFDREAPPATPIVLRLPPTGRLLAQLRHEGQPRTDGVRFLLLGATDTDPGAHAVARSGLGGGTACDADGWARFPYVPIGHSFQVYASSNGSVVEATAVGPVRAGDEVRVELTTDDVITIVGRLLGPDAQPLAGAGVGVSFFVEGTESGGRRFTTDAQGRFTCPLAKSPRARAPLQHLLLTCTGPDASPLRATIAPRDVVAGRNDLGDVTMDAGPLVVAGRLVFDPPDRTAHVTLSVTALAETLDPNGKEHWDPQYALTLTRQPDGRFEVHGEAKPARHRIEFSGAIAPMPPREFRVGERDLVVTLGTGSELTARCTVPTWLGPMQLRGVLRQAPSAAQAAATEPWSTFAVRRGTDGATLHWQQLPPGTYTLELGMLGVQAPLASLADVDVPQPTPGDPRLLALDVRERVGRRTLRVVREPAAANADGSTLVFVMPQADPENWTGFAAAGDEIEIVAPPGPIELQVLRAGHRPVQTTANDDVITVRLEAWPNLELTFADLPPLPDGVTLHGSLRDVDATRGPSYRTATGGGSLASARASRSFVVKDGRATVAPGDGTFRPVVYLQQNGNRRVLRAVTPEQLVGNAAATFAVQLSADEIRTALGELAAMPAKK